MAKCKKKKHKEPSGWAKRCIEASLLSKRELIQLIFIDVILVVLAFFLYTTSRNQIALWSPLLAGIAVDYWILGKPKRILERKRAEDENEFVHLFSYFSIYVRNGEPVYSALEDTIRYASSGMSSKLQTLLTSIDEDKSVKPYLAFAENFPSLEIQQVMISVYKMSVEGEGEAYLRQFETIFESLADGKRQERMEQEQKRYSNFNFLPTMASALSMGIIAVAIVILMEQFNHVV